MEDIKETILQQCLKIFKREEVKKEFVDLMQPVIQMLLNEIYPYIFISIIFVFISFLLILGIFIILLRSKFSILKQI
tara:strand:+ start:97 stop:327 length:231 start_codon:yes stop_codon:yes gene_type:complete